jgi:acetyl-CoA carboxylase biotin carboxyl carrier protein
VIFSRKITIDPELVRELSKLLEETGLGEIEIERGGTRVRVARDSHGAARTPAPAAATARPAGATGGAAEPAENYSKHPGAVLSPMVGTAYRANEPGGKPLCEVGDQVNAGQALLIVEAMKTMNAIPAPRPGKVAKILFEDAQPVEFGEPLVILE